MRQLSHIIAEAPIVTKQKSHKNGGSIDYFNIPIAFDIETTSLPIDEYGGKYAFPYMFALAVNDQIVHMRTIEEFVQYMDELAYDLDLNFNKRIAVWVHNLAFEFTFLQNYFTWSEQEIPFANGNIRKVIRALTSTGIEFRCSYALTGQSLEKAAEETNVEKMVGDLDYELIRHQNTPMTKEEMGYVNNDVLILTELIRGRLESDSIASIPMTSTGYVRRRIRSKVLQDTDYRKLMDRMNVGGLEMLTLRQTFMGGYTHANPDHVFETQYRVSAADIGSSYPAQIVAHQYPMTKAYSFNRITPDEYLEMIKKYHVIAKLSLKNVINKGKPFSIISRSKVLNARLTSLDTLDSPISGVDNGRIYSASQLQIYATEEDFRHLKMFYDFEIVGVESVLTYGSAYLPATFIEEVVSNYKGKTELKDVAGKEDEYNASKEGNNGVYGMMVTDPIRPEFRLIDGALRPIEKSDDDIFKEISKSNTNPNKFLSYVWGVYVTAYARGQLYDMILKLDDAGVEVYYTDTDSVYFKTSDDAYKILKEENLRMEERMRKAAKHHGFNYEELTPKNPKGDIYPLGAWEFDGEFAEFKTLGAKRYATLDYEGNFTITASGLHKKKASAYIESLGGMEAFSDGLVVPEEHSGRNIASYAPEDESFEFEVEDYQGNIAKVKQKGWMHLSVSDFSLKIADEFEAFANYMKLLGYTT